MGINHFLEAGEVVVGIEHCYNDSNGSYSLAYVWNGKVIRIENYANGYNNGSFDDARVNATREEIKRAGDWYEFNQKDNAGGTYVGCVVSLRRCRKAKNCVPLKVESFVRGEYNTRHGRYEGSRVFVRGVDGSENAWVSVGCIHQVLKGVRPFWAREY